MGSKQSYLFLVVSIIVTICVAFFIYLEISYLFKYSLQQRVLAIATTSALQFSSDELDKITGPESVDTDEFKSMIFRMQKIRLANPALKFIDIFRKTNDPTLFEYVVDVDSLHPEIEIDLNADGVINDEDALVYPGDIYDGSEVPNFVENAFVKPDVDPDLEESQWGLTLDASAPIYDRNGNSNYVFNVSLDVSEFIRHTYLAFIPFLIFVILIIAILIFLTMSLVKIWGSHVTLLRDLDRQKDELLSIVSHQLATPVSSFKWYLEMLLDGDLGELSKEQKEHIKTMQSIGVNLSDLVSMILDVSRIQLGRMKVEKQSLDLNEFFKEIIEIIQPKAIQKNLTFKKKLPSKLPANAMLDRRYTHMTIENLLSNAVKYTPEKGTVTFNVEIKNNRMLCVVKDTGMGIPKSEQDKIFGRMFRASNVRNTVDGNGFGLFVAKGAVEAQGGKIWFESTEGKGTTFYVDLPLFEK